MKQQINEIRRMQQLAGIIKEATIKMGDDGYGNPNITVKKEKEFIVISSTSNAPGMMPGTVRIPIADIPKLIAFLSSSSVSKETLSSEKVSEMYDISETKVKGLIPFEQVKQLIIRNYKEMVEPEDIAELNAEFKTCNNIDELVNVLDNYGVERDDVYDFVLSLLIK